MKKIFCSGVLLLLVGCGNDYEELIDKEYKLGDVPLMACTTEELANEISELVEIQGIYSRLKADSATPKESVKEVDKQIFKILKTGKCQLLKTPETSSVKITKVGKEQEGEKHSNYPFRLIQVSLVDDPNIKLWVNKEELFNLDNGNAGKYSTSDTAKNKSVSNKDEVACNDYSLTAGSLLTFCVEGKYSARDYNAIETLLMNNQYSISKNYQNNQCKVLVNFDGIYKGNSYRNIVDCDISYYVKHDKK